MTGGGPVYFQVWEYLDESMKEEVRREMEEVSHDVSVETAKENTTVVTKRTADMQLGENDYQLYRLGAKIFLVSFPRETR